MGSAWMLLAGASFALMGVLVKLGAQWFSSHELVFYRSLIALALLLAGMTLRHGITGGRHFFGEHTALHLRRGLVGFLALAAFFYAVAHLPLSLAITLNYSSPLFLALLMPWQLKEWPSRAQYATVAVGFLGVALLLRPWDSAPQDLLAGLDGWHVPATHEHLGVLLGVGLFATLGQLTMTRAYRKGDTVVVAAFAYSTVVFGSILDALIFNMEMPTIALLGMLITVLAGIQAARFTRSST